MTPEGVSGDRPGEQVNFASFARNATSQAGEDGIIAALLQRLPERDRWCVEFGAWDGKVASNSAALIGDGYSAVLIEGDSKKFRDLARHYVGSESVITVCCMVGWEGRDTLDQILGSTTIPEGFDLLSIDIDGNDYHVWEAVRDFRPKIVVIEFNPTIPNGVEFVQAANPKVHQGSSISSLVNLARRKGYELVATTELNAFFARGDLFPAFGIIDNAIDRLRTDTSWQSQIFFGFDGRAVLRGGKGLYWHGLKVPDEIRLVPRVFVGWPGGFGSIRGSAYQVWLVRRYVRDRGWAFTLRRIRRLRESLRRD